MAGSALTLRAYRTALDLYWDATEIEAHPAQVCAWEELAYLLGLSAYAPEQVQRQRDYWLGRRPNANRDLPKDEIHFMKDGLLLGTIQSLQVPFPYAV